MWLLCFDPESFPVIKNLAGGHPKHCSWKKTSSSGKESMIAIAQSYGLH